MYDSTPSASVGELLDSVGQRLVVRVFFLCGAQELLRVILAPEGPEHLAQMGTDFRVVAHPVGTLQRRQRTSAAIPAPSTVATATSRRKDVER